MPLFGQPPPSPPLTAALHLLKAGMPAEAETVVVKAAKDAKKEYGSGSHPLALAYADMARFHHATGKVKQAATEFQHAIKYPAPGDTTGKRDRLAIVYGYGGCLDDLGRTADAEKVYRQCVLSARAAYGAGTAAAAAAVVPLTDVFLRTDHPAEAARLLDAATQALLAHRDPAAPLAAALRAEAHRLLDRPGDPFAGLMHAPVETATAVITVALNRAATDPHPRRRPVLDDVAKFAGKRFGDGHGTTTDTLAAVVRLEAALGTPGSHAGTAATRRAVWSFAARRPESDLLDDVEVGFDPDGTIHLAPKLTKEPSAAQLTAIEAVLVAALDDLYARPAR